MSSNGTLGSSSYKLSASSTSTFVVVFFVAAAAGRGLNVEVRDQVTGEAKVVEAGGAFAGKNEAEAEAAATPKTES